MVFIFIEHAVGCGQNMHVVQQCSSTDATTIHNKPDGWGSSLFIELRWECFIRLQKFVSLSFSGGEKVRDISKLLLPAITKERTM